MVSEPFIDLGIVEALGKVGDSHELHGFEEIVVLRLRLVFLLDSITIRRGVEDAELRFEIARHQLMTSCSSLIVTLPGGP